MVRRKGTKLEMKSIEIDGALKMVTWELTADGFGGFGERRAINIAPARCAS